MRTPVLLESQNETLGTCICTGVGKLVMACCAAMESTWESKNPLPPGSP